VNLKLFGRVVVEIFNYQGGQLGIAGSRPRLNRAPVPGISARVNRAIRGAGATGSDPQHFNRSYEPAPTGETILDESATQHHPNADGGDDVSMGDPDTVDEAELQSQNELQQVAYREALQVPVARPDIPADIAKIHEVTTWVVRRA